VALWIALGLAFSPVALDLAAHLGEHAWARYALVFPLLFVRLARRDESQERSPAGTLLIAAGLVMELATAFAGAIRWARPAPILAAIGICQREGVASWRSRALLLFAVPLPAFVMKIGERGIASAMGESAAGFWSLTGSSVALVGSALQAGSDELLVMNRAWLPLAPLLAGLAWYDAVLLRRSLPAALATCAAAAAAALPIQTLGLTAAIGLALLGANGMAQALVDDGVWLAVAIGGVALIESRLRWTEEEMA
jgi:hypothetical protein